MEQKTTLLEHILTIPEAQTRVLDLEWQSTFYTVFHQTRTSRIFHAFCMAPIVLCLFVFATFIDLGVGSMVTAWAPYTAINGGLIVLLFLTVWYVAMDVKVGLATIPVILSLWVVANLLTFGLGDTAWWLAIGVLAVCTFLQTVSHQPEPVPPPHSGTDAFVEYSVWYKSSSFWNKVKVTVLFPVFMTVELVSSPRLMPVQILRLMHKFGFRKEMEARTERKAQHVLATGDYQAYHEVD